jgi:hypothetical protein
MSDQKKTRTGEPEEAMEGFSECFDGEDGKSFEGWWEDRSLPEKIFVVIGFAILGIGLLFLFGYVVMLLWNWLMPEIFGLKTLTYWQAWGMLALSCILFGRIGGSGASGSSDRKRKRKLRTYMREQECKEVEDTAGSAKA